MKNKLQIELKNTFEGGERNLFFVSTALQLLNAVEAQKYFKTKNNILVLLYYGNQNNDQEQLENLLELFDYSKLIIFDVSNKKKYIKIIISLIKELKQESYDKVFTGYFSANLRRFIANTTYKELLLIDDGVYSIAIHNELYNPYAKGYKKYITEYSEKKRTTKLKQLRFDMYHKFRKLCLKIYGCKNDMANMDLKFFTIFDLPQHNNEIIIKNNYDFLKSYYHIKSTSQYTSENKTVYFLGQPLSRSINMSHSEYLLYIESIFEIYNKDNKKVIYIPHRSEGKETIEAIKEIQSKDIEVQELSMPFELYVLKNGIEIKHIASFVSTALFTIKKLYPYARVDAFKFPVSGQVGKTASLIYDMLAKDRANIFQWNGNCSYGVNNTKGVSDKQF